MEVPEVLWQRMIRGDVAEEKLTEYRNACARRAKYDALRRQGLTLVAEGMSVRKAARTIGVALSALQKWAADERARVETMLSESTTLDNAWR